MSRNTRRALVAIAGASTFFCLSYAVEFDDLRREFAFAASGAVAVWAGLLAVVR